MHEGQVSDFVAARRNQAESWFNYVNGADNESQRQRLDPQTVAPFDDIRVQEFSSVLKIERLQRNMRTAELNEGTSKPDRSEPRSNSYMGLE